MRNVLSLAQNGPVEEQIKQLIRAVRSHLGMDIGFLSEFRDGRRFFRQVDASVPNCPVVVGESAALSESYCHLIAIGKLPELMHDAADLPAALAMPVTKALPVGAHLSVPIRLEDGSIYGMFCCFSHAADPSLNERDLALLRLFAELTGRAIQQDLAAKRDVADKRERIERVINERDFFTLYQPIYRLTDDSLAGFEALCRFLPKPQRAPDRWFAEATEAGLGVELEFAAAENALLALLLLAPGVSLAINLSPQAIISPRMDVLFGELPLERLILEITEHAAIDSYSDVERALAPFRRRGLRLAVDDAGAGHSSFKHVLDLKPDLIKLDMSLTRNVDRDDARCALAKALTAFGREMGCQIVAEGVETESELNALRKIGVTKVQGYLVGVPMSLSEAAALPLTRDGSTPKDRAICRSSCSASMPL